MNIHVLQFGEGNFLRAFAECCFDALNEKTSDSYRVTIVQPIPDGRAEELKNRGLRYHVVTRSKLGGKPVESVRRIECVTDSINPFTDFDAYRAAVLDPELRLIVSNTTEAGIAFRESDSFGAELEGTYPAKLTKLLYSRFLHFGGSADAGLYILPCELIENNAAELLACVRRYIALWGLPDGFSLWVDSSCFFCGTLVDRIVPGFPVADREYVRGLIGEDDPFVTVCEPFGLWVIEDRGDISRLLPRVDSDIDLVTTRDIAYYKRRKVRVLNAAHTSLVPLGLERSLETVSDCLKNAELAEFLRRLLDEEIVPYVDSDISKTADYARSVVERFGNPFLNHRLTSISLNSISKWRARVLPAFRDFYADRGELPACMSRSFAALMAMYSGARKTDEGYFTLVGGRRVPLNDEPRVLELFADSSLSREQRASAAMGADGFFGEDLTEYAGLESLVTDAVRRYNA